VELLALAPYPPSAPSTRYRLQQLARPLEEAGIRLTVRTFLDEAARAAVERGGIRGARALAGRVGALREAVFSAGGHDAVLVQRGLSVAFDGWFLRSLADGGRPLLYDFDDAVHLPQEGGRRWLERLRRPEATTAAFCRRAAVVLPGNDELAAVAREARGGGDEGAVRVLPTVVDADRFRPPGPGRGGGSGGRSGGGTGFAGDGPPTVGWVGSDSTVGYLEELGPALRELQRRTACRVLVVAGRRRPRLPGVDYTFRRWGPEAEVGTFQELDVGLYPLQDTPWGRGKCGFKALQYLACGVPCVASPVGVLREIVRPGETGRHATDAGEWVAACQALLEDPAERGRLGGAGRALVERAWSVPVAVEILSGAVDRALAGA
jgi:hypothetical protein